MCQEHDRAIMIEEMYRFPLSAALSILGTNGICHARCQDFPTFCTGMDVQWIGLSDSEVAAVRDAEELVTVATLLGVLEAKGGALVLAWQRRGFGGRDGLRLPLSVRGAAVSLAKDGEATDLDEQPLRGARDAMRLQIEHNRRSGQDEKRNQDVRFLKTLKEHLDKGWGTGVRDWNMKAAAECLERFCAKDTDLLDVRMELWPPDEAEMANLRRKHGDAKPGGGHFDKEGLYCPTCGAVIGETQEEAARNGWRCYIDPSHSFLPGW